MYINTYVYICMYIYIYIYICIYSNVYVYIHLYVVISGSYIVTIYIYHSAEY